jgi:hypothetical protein
MIADPYIPDRILRQIHPLLRHKAYLLNNYHNAILRFSSFTFYRRLTN